MIKQYFKLVYLKIRLTLIYWKVKLLANIIYLSEKLVVKARHYVGNYKIISDGYKRDEIIRFFANTPRDNDYRLECVGKVIGGYWVPYVGIRLMVIEDGKDYVWHVRYDHILERNIEVEPS